MFSRLILVMAVSLMGWRPSERLTPAPTETEKFLREILVDLVSRGIPDYHVPEKGPILIQREMSEDRLILSDRALPTNDAMKFKLIRWSSADKQAFLTRHEVRYFFIADVKVSVSEASLVAGGDFETGNRTTIKLCCCSAIFRYRRNDGHWVFVDTQTYQCS